MKGVILAGGLGTRLYPLTHVTNKHLLPVYDKPMIFYPIETLVKTGIKEIMIVTSGPHVGHFLGILKNGTEFGLEHLEYAYQEKPDGGISDAISLAKSFADNEPICVMLGDNTTDADISTDVKNFKEGAMIFLKQVPDPARYGVPVFDEQHKILRIEEKPRDPKSKMAVAGVYIYDNNVFDYIKTLKLSERGQLEVTDLNNIYLEKGKLQWTELKGFWHDAGTFDHLLEANIFWAKKAGTGG